jgi:8-oxo-dGTP diphosphatase
MEWRNPKPTVDTIIRIGEQIVLIRRRNPPIGWALPGGFVDEWERVEDAAVREAREETELDVTLDELFYVYSDPSRDPRKHTITVVFTSTAEGEPVGADDAAEARLFSMNELPSDIVFDHAQILSHYKDFLRTGERPKPQSFVSS